MGQEEAVQLAVALLAGSQRDVEPPLAIDTERVRESNGLLIVPTTPRSTSRRVTRGNSCWTAGPSSSTLIAEMYGSGPSRSGTCGGTRPSDRAEAAHIRTYGTSQRR
jgi:hypothetical protein